MRVVVIAALFAIGGCAATDAPHATREHASVTIRWMHTDAAADAECRRGAKQYGVRLGDGDVLGCASMVDGQCIIVAVQPTSFDDRARMGTLGHELLHCLGASHK